MIGHSSRAHDMEGYDAIGLRLAHCKSATFRTLTAQQLGVADAPLQRTEAWRLALRLKAGMAVVKEVRVRRAAMTVVVCMVGVDGCREGQEVEWWVFV